MKIGFIGSGNMASAIVRGMLISDFNPSDIYLSDNNSIVLQQKQQEFGTYVASTEELMQICEVVFLAVKPQVIHTVCIQIQPFITSQTIVSIAAGVTTNVLQNILSAKNIIRAMPNTPATIGMGATGLFAMGAKNQVVEDIFTSLGVCAWVDNEEHIDIITALSGSGPAYFFLIFEAMIQSSVAMGLDVAVAKKLCLQTAIGSATIANGDIEIATLRENVTSKGGTTQAALNSFMQNNLTSVIGQAMQSAKERANELSSSI